LRYCYKRNKKCRNNFYLLVSFTIFKMEISKELRLKLGFTRSEMADLTGCTPGQWAMAETGQRKLPLQVRDTCYKLEVAIPNLSTQMVQHTLHTEGKTAALAKKMLKKFHLKLKKEQLQQEKLLETREKTQLKLHIAEQLIQQAFLANDEIASLQLGIIQRKASLALHTLSEKLLHHALAIAAVQAQIEILNRFNEVES